VSREPWKRAAQLSRLQQRRKPGPSRPGRTPGSFNFGACALIAGLVLLVAVALTAWLSRNWWIPRYRDRLPEVVAESVKEPRVYPDFVALEQGMGAGLVVFGDYTDLIAGTRDWRTDWQVTQTGPENLRLEATGIRVYIRGGMIETYNIDLQALLEDEQWAGWRPAWERAGLTPDLTWPAYSGEQEMPGGLQEDIVVSDKAVKHGANWVRPAWALQFHNGWLRRIEARIEFGASTGDDG
jgi:hypothetical protein